MANEAFSCASYEPGHNVHFIQARVKAHLPRFWAKVDLIGPNAVRVVSEKQDQVLFHHNAIELYMWTMVAHEGEIKYCPESRLIYIRVDEYLGDKEDVWIMAYLSEGDLTPCNTLGARDPVTLDELLGTPEEGGTI